MLTWLDENRVSAREQDARQEPVLETAPEPARDPYEPAVMPTARPEPVPQQLPAQEPEITQIDEEPTMKVFVAVPVEGKTDQEIREARDLAERFCRAFYSGQSIQCVHYSDYAVKTGERFALLGRAARVFSAAQQCDEAFFSAGCEGDSMLEIVRSAMDQDCMPYNAFCRRNA